MKNALPLVLVGIAGIGVGFALRGAPQGTPPAVVEQAKTKAIEESMTPVEGTVVHTFASDDEMRAFAQRWQQRQALLIRQAMLEAYWNNEQSSLNAVNQRITNDYQLDSSKNYVLDSERRVILERPGAPGDDAPATPPAAGAEEKAVYTFPDQAAMESFAQLWQQRQSVIVRMAVLKAYWDSEKQALTDVDQAFMTQYHMDMTKQYTLDDKRRVLIERPAPAPSATTPATQPGASAPQATPAAPAQTPQ
jgi:hypothetical protein